MGGKWSTSGLSKLLWTGTFTAVAKEKSGLGNAEGESAKVTFEVNTTAPTVTIVQPATPSNKTEPSFSGTASERRKWWCTSSKAPRKWATASTTASGGKWSTSGLSKALSTGNARSRRTRRRSAVWATRKAKRDVTFEVDTEKPVVTLAQPLTPSNKAEPSFSGTASEATEVVVHVFEGTTEVATAKATASGGKWSTAALTKALTSSRGTFTAVAKEKSGLGNAEGESAKVTFEINTEKPVVTIAQPTTPSNKTEPSFSGTASEDTEVVVHVFERLTEVATASTTAAGGKWSTSGLSKALLTGKHIYTAQATEVSGLGNEEGESGTVSFEVEHDGSDGDDRAAGHAVEQNGAVVLGDGQRSDGSRGARLRRAHRSGDRDHDGGGREMVDERAEQALPTGNARSPRTRRRSAAWVTKKAKAGR